MALPTAVNKPAASMCECWPNPVCTHDAKLVLLQHSEHQVGVARLLWLSPYGAHSCWPGPGTPCQKSKHAELMQDHTTLITQQGAKLALKLPGSAVDTHQTWATLLAGDKTSIKAATMAGQ